MAPQLSNIFEIDCFNFAPVQLHDTYMVIDAQSLYSEICRRQSAQGYGVGLLQVANTFREAMKLLQDCNIKPILLFQGVYKRASIEWIRKICNLKKSFRRSVLPSLDIPPDQFASKSRNCNCDLDTLLTVLEGLNISYLFVDGDIVSIASATALLMDCPLLGSDPLFYVMSCNSSDEISGRLKFYPLSGMSLDVPLDDASCPYFLAGHLYEPSQSILSSLSPFSCRIFSVLWGASSIPQLGPPQEVAESDMQGIIRYKYVTTATELVNWLAEVGPSKAIETALSLIEDKDFKEVVSECIPSSVDRTGFDVNEALLVIRELGLDPVLELGGRRFDTYGAHLSSIRPREGNLSHWPPRMLKAYRRGLVCPFILTALYSETGKIFTCNLDYVASLPSTYAKSLPVRFLHYCLMYTFEKSIGGCAHLDRNNSKLIEIHPFNSDTVEITSIPLQCLKLLDHEFNGNFIYRTFSYISNAVLPGWLNLFSLALLIWLKQSSLKVSPDKSPVILAVAICALAQSFNSCEGPENILLKYKEACEKAQNEYKSLNQETVQCVDLPGCQHIIHSLVEIQNIYMEIIAVRKFLKALDFYNKNDASSEDSFRDISEEYRPSYQIFPSNELLYWITKCLYTVPPEQRRYCAIRMWLPQIMVNSMAPDVSERCIAVVTDLNNLLNHLKTAKIRLVKTGQVLAQVPLSKVIEMTKTCVNVRQTLESFLPVAQPSVDSQGESKGDYQPLTCKGEEQMEYRRSWEKNGSKNEKQTVLWSRKKTNIENSKMNSASYPEGHGRTISSSTKRGRGGSNYAATLRKRVGIE